MPLTTKGKKIKSAMEKTYGKKKGEEVFHASERSGKVKGVAKKATGGGVAKKTAPKPKKTSDTRPTPRKAQEPTGYAKGGKTESRVNEAGNYTKPTMRKNLFNKIKAGGKGGKPGQWSARKAQMLAKEYKAKGGSYT
jgi:hypothetical protein